MAKKMVDMTSEEYYMFMELCGKVFKEIPLLEDTSILREVINDEENKAKEQLDALMKRNNFLRTMLRQIEDGKYKQGGR